MTDGMKSSEFWISAMTPVILTILNKLFGLGLSAEEIAAASVGPGAYAISRGMAK